ncbi:uncharacterized protein LOC143902221 isoform X2 [Temnothorax americanus]|uniref:uncharacterized protein LOC143902221 isoform X2 n=1 Tax=Temnothorax americanus TaxID=1964332 RepID=UPI0040693918
MNFDSSIIRSRCKVYRIPRERFYGIPLLLRALSSSSSSHSLAHRRVRNLIPIDGRRTTDGRRSIIAICGESRGIPCLHASSAILLGRRYTISTSRRALKAGTGNRLVCVNSANSPAGPHGCPGGHASTALSIFFQEAAIPSCAQGAGTHFGQITPCNTPATPPNFPDTLLAFSKMSAGEKTPSGMSPSQNGFQVNSTPMASIVQHHAAGGRCSASGNTTQQQTQSQQTQFGLGEPQR